MAKHESQKVLWGVEFKPSTRHRNWHFWEAFESYTEARDAAEDWFGKSDKPHRLVGFVRSAVV